MKNQWLAGVLLCAAASSQAEVDPALVGTWQLQGFAANVLWVVRSNGDYRLHGAGAQPPQRGRFDGAAGKWSVSAPSWQDAGTYRLTDANSWVVTGQFGTGTWKRVWAPGQSQQDGPGERGVCDWLKPSEVALVLAAPVKDGEAIGARNSNTGEAIGGCRFESRFGGERVELEVESTVNKREDAYTRAKQIANAPIAVPGLGDDAYAIVDGPMVKVRGKNRILTVTLAISASSAEDLPGLIELARSAYGRMR